MDEVIRLIQSLPTWILAVIVCGLVGGIAAGPVIVAIRLKRVIHRDTQAIFEEVMPAVPAPHVRHTNLGSAAPTRAAVPVEGC